MRGEVQTLSPSPFLSMQWTKHYDSMQDWQRVVTRFAASILWGLAASEWVGWVLLARLYFGECTNFEVSSPFSICIWLVYIFPLFFIF